LRTAKAAILINNNTKQNDRRRVFLSTAAAVGAGLTAFVFALTTSCNLQQNTAINRQLHTAALFCLQPPWHTKLV